MISNNVSLWLLMLALLVAAGAGGVQTSQKHEPLSVLNSPVDATTAVRFFYDPPGDYFHFPLVFRVADESNPVLNTAPMRQEGRTAYISLSEMHQLLQGLSRSSLGWKESERAEAMGSSKKLKLAGIGLDTMQVLIVFSHGTAKAQIAPKEICKSLKPLDAALKTPRALWELQRFQLNYGCKVSGFKYDAYPDHY